MTRTKPIHVLVAEDDALVCDGTAGQLSRLGYSLAGCAYDGPQAVELTAERRPSVILMDLQMIDPDTGREDPQAGLKATRQIQDRFPTAVVILTAHESPDLVYQATEAGANGYLVKPAGDLELSRAITIAQARFRDLTALRRLNTLLHFRNEKLQAALKQAKPLVGLITACANCRKVRDDRGEWQRMERYIQTHTSARFSHGLCPECATALYPDIFPEPPKL
ncbi:MAG TPA: response regulator transcription factor [Verrucomicrobiae bacterium]